MASEVDRVIAQLDSFAERLIGKLVLDIAANLKEVTPVDTGWARANWVAQIGSAPIEDLSSIDPTSSSAQAKEGISQSSLAGVITSYKLERGAVYLSNNVPYITKLNSGSSRQAPAGFVQRAIEKAVTVDILSI